MNTEQLQETKKLANLLQSLSGCDRWNNNSRFTMFYDPMYRFLAAVEKTDTFGAKVANSVRAKAEDYEKRAKKMAFPFFSSKQAWCIACAAIENGIEF